jgi:hypothetical protein
MSLRIRSCGNSLVAVALYTRHRKSKPAARLAQSLCMKYTFCALRSLFLRKIERFSWHVHCNNKQVIMSLQDFYRVSIVILKAGSALPQCGLPAIVKEIEEE